MSSLPSGFAQLKCLALFSALLAIAGCDLAGPPPNIILITLDTTRADHLGCYGSEIAATPHLDRFAETAILFENALTAVPITLPSHSTMMTGMTPLGHGVRNNGSFVLAPHLRTLAEILAEKGYTTAAFVSAFVLARQFGIDQGFRHYDDSLVNERSAAETTNRALRWIRGGPDGPLFLWVHYFDPHTPWVPIEPFASATRGDPYDAEISAMDASLGDLLRALDEVGLTENAHILILGDHGEGLNDHEELEHGIFLYEEAVRIPFLWRTPGRHAPLQEPTLVGTVDILPTLLDLLGLAPPPDLEGLSLARLLADGAAPDRDGLYIESLFPYYNYEWSPLFAWRSATHKYIAAPRPELYDLTSDPHERTNLQATENKTAGQLARRLRNYRLLHETDEGTPEEGTLDPEVEERLKSLGYIWSAGQDRSIPTDSLPDPKDLIQFHTHFERAKQAMDAHEYQAATEAFRLVLDAFPDNPTASLGMGLALLQVREPHEALRWLDHHLTIKPGNATAHEGRGDALAQLGRYPDALAAYAQAAGNPMAARSLARKEGLVLARMGRPGKALLRFQKGLSLSSGDDRAPWNAWVAATETLVRLGWESPSEREDYLIEQIQAAAQLDLFEAGWALLDKAERTHPATLTTALRGDLAIACGRWHAARTAYAEIRDLNPERTLRHALAALQEEDIEAARRILRAGIATGEDPGGRQHYNLACLEAQAGEHDAALEMLVAAIRAGYTRLDHIRTDPDLAPLRADPRFEALLR